jgi:hemerythrin
LLWWTEELATGIDSIDNQHKSIFEEGEKIIQFDEETSKKSVENSFKYLINYVIEHFSSEENVMIRYCYDNFEDHRNKHTHLIVNLHKLYKDFRNNGLDEKLLDDFKLLIIKWLINHIDQDDKKFAYFMRKAGT